MKEQFQRIARFIGEENVEMLAGKTVSVAGIGAVGGFACEMLARCGVGHIRLLDFDTVSESNINRQITALHSTVGELKTDVMERRIRDINPDCFVESFPEFLTWDSHSRLFDGADFVLDCIDDVKAKADLLEDAWRRGIPIASSMGAALRKDISLIREGDLMDTSGCPLARRMRAEMRHRGVGRGIMAVYSPEPVSFTYTAPDSDPDAESIRGRKRMVLGSLPFVTAVFGEMLSSIALRHLLPPGTLG